MPAANETKGQAEALKLKNKILELESQLKDLKKVSSKLREGMEKKLSQISNIEQETVQEVEKFRWRKAQFTDRLEAIESESNEKINSLKESSISIKTETSGFDVLQHENDFLHKKLKEAAILQANNIKIYTSELEKKKQKDFDARMALEEIMRKMIKNCDADYKRDAVRISVPF